MKKQILFLVVLLSAATCLAQQEDRRWSGRLSAGLSAFNTMGIPQSRNQINYESLNPDAVPSYDQESRIAGLALEAGLYYRLQPSLRVGVILNAFRDDDEYIGTSDLAVSALDIAEDSLQSVSVRNMQSYLNLGLSAEYDLYPAPNRRHRITFALSTGLSVNRTPDRTEFDYFEENNFITAPPISSGDTWYITHTAFHNGWFVMPSVIYGWQVRNNHWLNFSIAVSRQWMSTSSQVQLLDRVSSGSLDRESYTLRALQIKLGYSF